MNDQDKMKVAREDIADTVVEANRELLLSRSRVGIRKYGATLGDAGLPERELLVHALEEALDLANYLQANIQRADAEQARVELAAMPADVVAGIVRGTGQAAGPSKEWCMKMVGLEEGFAGNIEAGCPEQPAGASVDTVQFRIMLAAMESQDGKEPFDAFINHVNTWGAQQREAGYCAGRNKWKDYGDEQFRRAAAAEKERDDLRAKLSEEKEFFDDLKAEHEKQNAAFWATSQELVEAKAQLARPVDLAGLTPEPYAHEYGKDNGDGSFSIEICRGEIPSYVKPCKDWPVKPLYAAPQPASKADAQPAIDDSQVPL